MSKLEVAIFNCCKKDFLLLITEIGIISPCGNTRYIISANTSIVDKNNCFLKLQNKNICSFLNICDDIFNTHLSLFKQTLIERGETEIDFWKLEIEKIKTYPREKAIDELITSLKLNEKIATITKFTESLR